METPVTFESAGQQVVGILHVPDHVSGPRPGVLFCHGFTGNKQETHRLFVQTARALMKEGIVSLRFDFRGSGDSAGEFSEATIRGELEDARVALRFLQSRPETDPDLTGVVGMSMGGAIAALLLGESPDVKAVVLWSAVADTVAAVKRKGGPGAAGQLLVKGYVDLNGWAVGRAFIEELAAARPLESVVKCAAPFLLIHGEADEAVPVADTHAYEAALQKAGRTVKKKVIRGAGHTYDSVPWLETLVADSTAWLAGHLAAS
jgi:dienelactone hydrolase